MLQQTATKSKPRMPEAPAGRHSASRHSSTVPSIRPGRVPGQRAE
jgi:hypothetical protein